MRKLNRRMDYGDTRMNKDIKTTDSALSPPHTRMDTDRTKKIIITLAISLLMVFTVSAISITNVTTSPETADTHPGVYMTDGDPATSWQLAANTTSGWAVFTLDEPGLIYGLELEGNLASELLAVEYLSEGSWHLFSGARLDDYSGSSYTFDLSLDGIMTDRLRLRLERNLYQNPAISAVKVSGEPNNQLYRKIGPASVIATAAFPYYSPASTLTDGDLSTCWQTNAYYLDDEAPAELEDLMALLKQSLRSVKHIIFTLEQLDNMVDFITTIEPLLKSAVPQVINYLDDLEQRGVLRVITSMLDVRAKIAAAYSPEDIDQIGDGVVVALGLTKKLSDPKATEFLEKLAELPSKIDLSNAKPVGLFGMLGALSNKQAKEGLGVLMELTRAMGELKNGGTRSIAESEPIA